MKSLAPSGKIIYKPLTTSNAPDSALQNGRRCNAERPVWAARKGRFRPPNDIGRQRAVRQRIAENPETTTKPYTRQGFSGHPNSRPQCHKCNGKGEANWHVAIAFEGTGHHSTHNTRKQPLPLTIFSIYNFTILIILTIFAMV